MLKNLVIFVTIMMVSSAFADTRPKPPAPSMKEMNQHRGNCKVPEFLVNIPPVMENDYTTCINDRFMPTKALIEVVLKQQVSKKAEFVKVEPAAKFYTKVYKVTYKIGAKEKSMICNDKMTYCLQDKPIVSRER